MEEERKNASLLLTYKMRRLLLLLLYVPFFALSQQVFVYDEYNDNTYPENSYQYLIADDVNIRNAPSTTSSVIANLPIATRLRIIEMSTERYTYNNISFPWYKVSFIVNHREKIGYVVGGFIAEEYYIIDDEKMLLSGSSKYNLGDIKYQIRAVKDHEEIDKIEFSAVEAPADYLNFDVHRDHEIGLYSIDIISMSFTNAHCGSQFNETTFFFDRGKLYHLKTFSNLDYKTLGFDNGRIQLYQWVEDNDDEYYPDSYKKELIQEYIWNGRRLQIY